MLTLYENKYKQEVQKFGMQSNLEDVNEMTIH